MEIFRYRNPVTQKNLYLATYTEQWPLNQVGVFRDNLSGEALWIYAKYQQCWFSHKNWWQDGRVDSLEHGCQVKWNDGC